MKGAKLFGLGILVLLWIWLVAFIFIRSGITLLNIIWVIISGIIVFVPLYKKYFKNSDK